MHTTSAFTCFYQYIEFIIFSLHRHFRAPQGNGLSIRSMISGSVAAVFEAASVALAASGMLISGWWV
jgi:hypothetical protein